MLCTYPWALIALLGGLAHGRLLQDELLELGGRGDEADLAALLDDAPDPPVGVVLLIDVEVVPNLEGDRRPVHGRVVVLFIVAGSQVKFAGLTIECCQRISDLIKQTDEPILPGPRRT